MFRQILGSFARRYMDVAITSRRDFDVRIIERPGRWMTDADLAQLSGQLRTVAAQTLAVGSLTYGVFSGQAERMEQVIITLVTRKDGTPIAFNALAVMNVELAGRRREVLHLGLVMVDPSERSRRLSWVLYGLTCFLIFFRRQFRPVWVSNVTQVPAVVGMVSETFSDVYPRPEGGRRSLNHLLLARRIMENHRGVFGVGEDADFDETRFVIENAYTGGSDDLKKTYDDAQKHCNDQYNTFCQGALDYARGDDFIQLGRMDMTAIGGYLRNEVPGGVVVSLVMAGAVVALQRLILPVVHWSDSTRHWKILRPAKGTDL